MKILQRFLFLSIVFSFSFATSFGQKTDYKISAIGFYNLENLFDTIDAPDIRDEEFTPEGSKLWNTKKYKEKLTKMAKVISLIATDKSKDGLAILGVSEIENRTVLEDLVKQPALASRRYNIIHFDSNDRRGIDLAILFQSKYFIPKDAKPIPVQLYSGTKKVFTRDILYVSGLYDGEMIHILVNHWPSRRGGEAKTAPWRAAAALECKKITDSLTALNPMAKVIIMGDLNDNPNNLSIKSVLNTNSKIKKVKENEMFNPMEQYYHRGIGTTAYRDAWSLFDQIILSYGWIPKEQDGLRFYKAIIFNKSFLVQKKGHFKGYPMRTFAGSEFIHGYSDHFPVFIYVVKAKL
jgi:hypothetical protein